MNLRKTEFFFAFSISSLSSGELLPEERGGVAGFTSGGVKAIIASAEIANVVAIMSDMFFK